MIVKNLPWGGDVENPQGGVEENKRELKWRGRGSRKTWWGIQGVVLFGGEGRPAELGVVVSLRGTGIGRERRLGGRWRATSSSLLPHLAGGEQGQRRARRLAAANKEAVTATSSSCGDDGKSSNCGGGGRSKKTAAAAASAHRWRLRQLKQATARAGQGGPTGLPPPLPPAVAAETTEPYKEEDRHNSWRRKKMRLSSIWVKSHHPEPPTTSVKREPFVKEGRTHNSNDGGVYSLV
ncbi:hypothetical protein Taro_050424 [Colocasia esculenta]|uniref:Uncharacterized protein n=1 Tax=Colocasia esculenta TaxID=4460 RepID=A0A843XDU2_COLES|nr:hypothetical protein [Colocasia esculenta]